MRNQLLRIFKSGPYKGSFVLEDEDEMETRDKFEPGIYTIRNIGGIFGVKPMYTAVERNEAYINFSSGVLSDVMHKADTFFSKSVRDKYKELGIAHKMGILLHGKPGTGKTVTSSLIMQAMAEKYNAICITVDMSTLSGGLLEKALRELGSLNLPIVLFVDECEATFWSHESFWLTFLDGHNSMDNIIVLACTNNKKDLPARMLRPSRVEHLIPMDNLDGGLVSEYIKGKLASSTIDSTILEGCIYEASEMGITMDVLKNAVKEFYVFTENKTVGEFKKLLLYYSREEQEAEVAVAEKEG